MGSLAEYAITARDKTNDKKIRGIILLLLRNTLYTTPKLDFDSSERAQTLLNLSTHIIEHNITEEEGITVGQKTPLPMEQCLL